MNQSTITKDPILRRVLILTLLLTFCLSMYVFINCRYRELQ